MSANSAPSASRSSRPNDRSTVDRSSLMRPLTDESVDRLLVTASAEDDDAGDAEEEGESSAKGISSPFRVRKMPGKLDRRGKPSGVE
jgi:hypothetical protein